MDEHLKDIDKLFQKATQKHSELPSAGVWEHLEKDLQKRNITFITKKYKKWRWLASLLFIFCVGIVMYTFHVTSQYSKAVKKIALDSANLTMAVNPPARPGNSTRNDNQREPGNLMAAGTGKQKSPLVNVDINPNAEVKANAAIDGLKSSEAATAGENTSRLAKADHSKNSIVFKTLPLIENKKRKVLKAALAPETGNIKFTRETGKTMGKKTAKPEPGAVASPDLSLLKDADSTGKNYSSFISPQEENFNLKPVLVDGLQNLIEIDPTAMMSLFNKDASNMDIAAAETRYKKHSKSSNRVVYTASLFYSWDQVSTQLTANHPDFKEDNYQQIRNHEKNRISNTFGFSLVRNIGRSWGIESGIAQTIYTTDIAAKPLVARKDDNGNINYRISTSAGYAYYAIKSIPRPGMADSIRTVSSKSTVKYITVPLGLQYYFNLGRVSLAPAILVSANFKTSGKIATVQSVEHSYSNDIVGLKSRYFDGTVRLGISSYLNRRIGISLMPFARFALSGATEGNPVTTRRNAVGLAAGLNFRF